MVNRGMSAKLKRRCWSIGRRNDYHLVVGGTRQATHDDGGGCVHLLHCCGPRPIAWYAP